MEIKDVKCVINDIRTIYILYNNENYRNRLQEAYDYIKSERIESIDDFTKREGLKIGAFTYDEITIFDRLKNKEYEQVMRTAFSTVNNLTKENAIDSTYGDKLASWGTLGYTPYRQKLIDEGLIISGLTPEETSKKYS